MAFSVSLTSHSEALTHYDEPGLTRGRDYLSQNFSEYIDPFSGNLSLHFIDLVLPGNGGFDLKVQRSYNRSKYYEFESPFGNGWDIHFGRVQYDGAAAMCASSGQGMRLELPDGSVQAFFRSNGYAGSSASEYLTKSLWKASCLANNTGIVVLSPDGTKYEMTESDPGNWHAGRITDRNGNSVTLTYVVPPNGGHKVVKTVAGPGFGTVTFTYSSGRLQSISGGGRTWQYDVQSVSGGANNLVRVTPPAGSPWVFTYLPVGYGGDGLASLKTVTNPFGGVTTYTYDHANFLPPAVGTSPIIVVSMKVTQGGSAGTSSWRFIYNPACPGSGEDVTTVVQPTSDNITYRHFGYCAVVAGTVWKLGLLHQKTIGNEQTETYDWVARTISAEAEQRPGYNKFDTGISRALLDTRTINRDGQNFVTDHNNAFDAYGNPTTSIEKGTTSTRTRTLSYKNIPGNWILGLPEDDRTSVGTITRGYDAKGNLTQLTKFNATTTIDPNDDGTIGSIRDPRGFLTIFSTYKAGIPQSETRPENARVTRTVDNFGNVTSETVNTRNTRNYTFDGLDRLTKIDFPVGYPMTIEWTGQTKTVKRGGSAVVELTRYDGFGRATSVTRGGVEKTLRYDGLGRKVFESMPGTSLGITTLLDALGRPKTETNSQGKRKTYTYSHGDVTVVDENLKSTTYKYDRYDDPDAGYLSAINSPDSTSVTMNRDLLGKLTSAIQGGVNRSYTYDHWENLLTITEPETGTTTFVRDAGGTLLRKTTGGNTITYDFDGLNRLEQIAYGGSAGTVTYDYDLYQYDKVTKVTNPLATREYDYDNNGNLTLDKLTVDGLAFSVIYGYDLADHLDRITYPTQFGPAVTLAPDILGRPTKLAPFLTGITYRPSGNFDRLTFGNGLAENHGEDSLQRPDSISGGMGLNLNYTYDDVGNTKTIAGLQGATVPASFTYDGANRMKTATGPWSSGNASVAEVITYYGSGDIANISRSPDPLIVYAYTSATNRISHITQGSTIRQYSYDSLGNTISNGRNVFEYDNASNLTRIDAGLPTETSFGYDGRGWRVWRQQNGIRTYYGHAVNGDLLYEYTRTGLQWKQHVYLAGKRVATQESDRAAVQISVSIATTGAPCEANPAYQEFKSITASVTSPGGQPTGTVNFVVVEGVSSGPLPLVAGSSTWNGATITPGFWSIVKGVYGGDTYFAPGESGSSNGTICISKIPPLGVLSVSPDSPLAGSPVTVTATINHRVNVPGPSKAFDVSIDGVVQTPTQMESNGQVVFNLTLTGGTHDITVHYPGDANYKAQSVATTVSVAGSTVFLTAPVNGATVLLGSPVTLQASVTPAAGATINGVEFKDGAFTISSDNTAPYAATWTPTSLGMHILKAVVTDSSSVAAPSPPVTVTVRNPGPTVTVSGTLTTQGAVSTCAYASVAEDIDGNWTVTCNAAGTKTFSIGPAIAGTFCAAYASVRQDVTGNWTVTGCIEQ